MFSNNKKQYINILKQNKQLKINYKITQDNKIIKEEQSSFIVSDDNLSEDAKFKINALQKNIKNSYITSLFENQNQHIVYKNTDVISYKSIKFGKSNNVIIPKNEINSQLQYFEDTGIDFILSPYTIIEEYLEDNGKKNSLNFLIYNNIIYSVIFNSAQELSYNKIKVLTPFESTQDETFSQDDIVRQKLYEEVSFLEIQQFLNETVAEYYEKSADVAFLEHIEMLYTLKPMSDEQILSLQESLMIPIQYKAISMDSYVDEIIQREDSLNYNFIDIREKKEDKSIYLWIGIVIATLIIAIGIFNYKLEDKKPIQEHSIKNNKIEIQKEVTKEIKQIPVIENKLSLPNHRQINNDTVQNIQMLFDVIPYDAILKDLEINKDSSTYISNFVVNSNSLSDMQTKLKNMYKTSKVLLEHQNKIIVNTIIQNKKLLKDTNVSQNTPYRIFNFLPISKASDYLLGLSIKNTIIKFEKKEKNKFLKYYFSLTSKIQSPDEFISFINKINSQKLSIHLDYPVTFSKMTNGIEVRYKIIVNQQNKKTVSLKK